MAVKGLIGICACIMTTSSMQNKTLYGLITTNFTTDTAHKLYHGS